MVDTSRLLKSAYIIPLSMSLAVASAWGFELKPDTDDTDYPTYTDSLITSNDDADGDSILIEGSPTGTGNAALLIDDDTAVTLDGMIRIRDYDDDNVNTPITDAIGLAIDFDVTDAAGIRLTRAATHYSCVSMRRQRLRTARATGARARSARRPA